MQHNFVFQLTFYPFQDKINRLPIYKHENSLETLQTRMLSYLLIQIQSYENSLEMLQTRMLFYLFIQVSKLWKQLRDAPDTDAILFAYSRFKVQKTT